MHQTKRDLDVTTYVRESDGMTFVIEYFATHVKIWDGDDIYAVLEYTTAPNGRRLYVEPYVDDVSWVSVEAWIDAVL
jgi:hypothetical protein